MQLKKDCTAMICTRNHTWYRYKHNIEVHCPSKHLCHVQVSLSVWVGQMAKLSSVRRMAQCYLRLLTEEAGFGA